MPKSGVVRSGVHEYYKNTYARPVYEKVGFVSLNDDYLEDGQPHVHMLLEFSE